MKTIHPAIAEHVMEENEKLREVLRCIADLPMDRCSTENDYRLSAAKAIALGALSQLAGPAPAQDEHDLFGTEKAAIRFCEQRGIDDDSPYRDRALDAFTSGAAWQRSELAAHPAQTEQQPIQVTAVAVMRDDGDGGLEPDWLLEGGTAELMAGMVLVVAEGDITGDDGHGEVYTAPIAQTAPHHQEPNFA